MGLQRLAKRKRSGAAVIFMMKQDKPLIDEGMYQAVLTDVFRFNNSFGQRIGFEFTLRGYGVDGRKVVRTTSTKLARKSRLSETLSALTRESEPIPQYLESLIGTRCVVLIIQQQNRQGKVFNSVERIFCSMKLA